MISKIIRIERTTEKPAYESKKIKYEDNMVSLKTVQEGDKEFQKVLKELGLENKQLTVQDFSHIYGYMQEAYCLE